LAKRNSRTKFREALLKSILKINFMNVHFIAIGGSAMHNLAIALSRKGINVTGSDDEIFEPSRTRLDKQGILPQTIGWNANLITSNLDAVILGMHAREDNPELLKAKELNIPIFSYPEYLYEQSKDKLRVVIGGSHGKTTITSMLLHVVNELKMNVDYMVGAQLEGYDCMVRLTEEAPIMILEGDEYLSSPIDRRPKFHLYKPNVAIISGIAWDHINVFPTFENYVDQFDIFCQKIENGGTLIYNTEDLEVKKLGEKYTASLNAIPYQTPTYEVIETGTRLHFENKTYDLQIFGGHNLQNLMGAMRIGEAIGINPHSFFQAVTTFKGAGKRLQKIAETKSFTMFKDFAHSPSKLTATTKAVKEQFASRKVIACMELHTFSSLKKEFLPHYKGAMDKADEAVVYFSHEVVKHKKLEPITAEMVKEAFGGNVKVMTETSEVLKYINDQKWNDSVLLMMSSGTFDGINYEELGEQIVSSI
jgi:UDP-N-acetylmuramate: L-alanyl-gamma-D-glutamyl-meso-diaminopimelate ligase